MDENENGCSIEGHGSSPVAEKKEVAVEEKTQQKKPYEFVNHPGHYNQYSMEAIDMIERVYGTQQTAIWCEITAFKYRLRMGTKPGESADRDLSKEKWYLKKRAELLKKLGGSN